ncbi:hypothetical protein [Patulibacter sp. SYSU D01012]|uniref:hypothetical protein n=1 Tax=Patulibacter sp. SYSU D01012 TaxID=2817381 RepID=UPI001B3166BF|nr:hypothetical protein [Patulibacter sp. SYSU D01012]
MRSSPLRARRRPPALVAALVLLLAVTGCGAGGDDRPDGTPDAELPAGPSYAGAPVELRGLKTPARAQGEDLALAVDGAFAPRFWPGVNLGATLPGTFPGELAPTRTDYDRWLTGMGELGTRLLRIYTILPPQFYAAFAAYNEAHRDRPIHLLHGVWIPEDEFLRTHDAYAVLDDWKRELADAVAVVHGDATIPDRPGHASGRYTADVSRWTLGWSLGVEWDPEAVHDSDRRNADVRPYRGRYVRATRDATPMESWIAAGMDHVATLEARRGWSRPLTFTNWLTTDPLDHPSEPLGKEDLVSVDATHVRATGAWPAGVFASYHAYPYYPDFLRWEYRDAQARDGAVDPYAGYLRALREHHRGMPIMVTEFGVPASLGAAHTGPLGRDQGAHSEQEAGRIDASMLGRIREEGYAGGVLFEWTDEWFKFTWNTIDLEQPGDRRALWRNPLTNEERFGVVATEAGKAPTKTLDGRDDDWTRESSQAIAESAGPVAEVRATHDEEFLWLRVRLKDAQAWRRAPVRIGLSTHPSGNRGLPGTDGADPDADHGVVIGPGDRATLLQAAWLDPLPWMYGITRDYVPFDEDAMREGSGAWTRPRQILNRPLRVGLGVGERPAEFRDASALPWGTGAPDADGFDQRHLVMGSGNVLELRIPWAMLGYADPSSHRILEGRRNGTMAAVRTGRVGITVQAGAAAPLRTAGYDWEGWNRPTWHERRKAGWPAIRGAFATSAADGPVGAARGDR